MNKCLAWFHLTTVFSFYFYAGYQYYKILRNKNQASVKHNPHEEEVEVEKTDFISRSATEKFTLFTRGQA